MLIKLATAVTVTGAVVATTGLTSASADTSESTTTTSTTSSTTLAQQSPGATTTTSTVAPPTTTASASPSASSPQISRRSGVEAAGAPVAGAFYGNPKPGVEIASGHPGLYPVFGAGNQPDLNGFSVVGSPAPGQPTVNGVPDPQPVCSPGTGFPADTAPNLYCIADTDNGFEFPMGDTIETFDLSVSASPAGFVHDPDQSIPISSQQFACPGSQGSTDDCASFTQSPPSPEFEYIGIYRLLEVTVRNSSGQDLSGVSVTLSCSAPAGEPSYACAPAGEKTNLSATSTAALTARAAPASTSTETVTTGSNGSASFAGAFLPGVTITLSVVPPAGYSAAGLSTSVPSPVTAATTTGASISTAARTPVDLALILPKAAPPSTTTTTTTTSTTTTTTTLAHLTSASNRSLPLTGTDAASAAEDAGLLLAAGAGLVTLSRRRARKGAHFKA
jgi:hypothetical protein